MKKQAYYLPSLNQLRAQSHSYNLHQQRLRQCKSEYELYRSLDQDIKQKRENLLVKLIPAKRSSSKADSKNIQDSDILRINRNYRLQLTPYEKLKKSEQSRQNLRIYNAMHILPRVESNNKKSMASQELLKERISKFTRQGTKISYKFKKSLLEVQKRKRHKDQQYSQQSDTLRKEAKIQLQAIIQRSINLNKNNEKQINLNQPEIHSKNKKNKPNQIQFNQLRQKSQNRHNNSHLKLEKQKFKTQVSNVSPRKKYSLIQEHKNQLMKDILSSRLEAVKQRAKKSQLSGNLKFFYQKQRQNLKKQHQISKKGPDIEIIEIIPNFK